MKYTITVAQIINTDIRQTDRQMECRVKCGLLRGLHYTTSQTRQTFVGASDAPATQQSEDDEAVTEYSEHER